MSAPPPSTAKTIGQNIREAREGKAMTQLQLAQAIGQRGDTQEDCKSGLGGSSFISRLERGHNEPLLDTLRRIAEVLGVSLDRLILGSGTVKGGKR